MRWHANDLDHATITIVRAKGGVSGTHPMSGDELRLMCSHQRQVGTHGLMDYVFLSERGAPLSVRGLQALKSYRVRQAGKADRPADKNLVEVTSAKMPDEASSGIDSTQ